MKLFTLFLLFQFLLVIYNPFKGGLLEARGPRSFFRPLVDNQNVMLKHLRLGKRRVIRAYFGPVFLEARDRAHYIFAQGRINSSKDDSQKAIVMVKSKDQGKSWSRPRVIFDPGAVLHEIVAYQNPSTDKLGLLFQIVLKNPKGKVIKREMVRLSSGDEGKTWQKTNLKEEGLNLYQWTKNKERFTTFQPTGMPIVVQEGPFKGRMVLSGYGLLERRDSKNPYLTKKLRAIVSLFSEDGGETWVMGNPQTQTKTGEFSFAGESTLTELSGGVLYMVVRPKKRQKSRFQTYSFNGGKTWSTLEKTKNLAPVSVFQSMTNFKRGNKGDVLLLSMPNLSLRMRGSVYFSLNQGASWKRKTLVRGFFDYSDIKVLRDRRIAVVYSRGGHGPFGVNISYFSLNWLINGGGFKAKVQNNFVRP